MTSPKGGSDDGAEAKGPMVLPVLPLRDIVVFPHMIVPLFVGREKSVRALENVMQDDKQILLVAQKNAADDNPSIADIYDVGTIGTVLQLLKLPEIGRASCRERVCQYVSISVVAVSLKKKTKMNKRNHDIRN